MALSHLNRSYNVLGTLSRVSYAANSSFHELQSKRQGILHKKPSNYTHMTNTRFYSQKSDLNISYRAINCKNSIHNCYRVQQLPYGSIQSSHSIENVHIKKLIQSDYMPNAQLHTNVPERKSNTGTEAKQEEEGLTKGQALKKAIVRYGPIILVFHIGHSLVTLGVFYVLVKSGVDMFPFAQKLVSGDTDKLQQVLYTSSTFAVAYTLYKLTAPIRIGITLVGFPYVLKVLRYFGYQRAPPPRPTKA